MTDATQTLNLPACFSDYMVLQHGEKIAVWGQACPQSEVSVYFQTQKINSRADEQGAWKVELSPCQINDQGSDLTIHSAGQTTSQTTDQTIIFHDVVVGSVWLCTGQSNMSFPLSSAENGPEDAKNALLPHIRYMQVTRDRSDQEQGDFLSDGWKLLSPDNAAVLSAVGFYFARKMLAQHKMPIGIIDNAWGGSAGECWLSQQSMADNLVCKKLCESFGTNDEAVISDYHKQVHDFRMQHADRLHDDPATQGYDEKWFHKKYHQSDWHTCERPAVKLPEQLEGDGIVWYRSDFELPAEWQNCACTIELNQFDCQRRIWIDEQEVEHTTWDTPWFWMRRIQHPLQTEKHISIVIRACYQFAGGNAYGNPRRLCLRKANGDTLQLDSWSYRKECTYPNIQRTDMEKDQHIPWPNGKVSWGLSQPITMFNALIAPLIPYSLDGVLWYQGESNVGRAEQYKDILSTLIHDWRQRWDNDLAFGIVQLAAFDKTPEKPEDQHFPEMRAMQNWVSKDLNNCGSVTALDVGDAHDIHPTRKQALGERLAQWASSTLYHDNSVWQSPEISSIMQNENGIEVTCANVVGALISSDNTAIRAFALAGEDGIFHWADAYITSAQTLIVTHPNITDAHAIRYAWSDNPNINLIDERGIPVIEFQQKL